MATQSGAKGLSIATLLSAILLATALADSPGQANEVSLPERADPPVQTTLGVPHVQIGVEIVPEVHAEFMRRVALLPRLDLRPTAISLPGATGFWLLEDLKLKRPQVIVGGREFAHVHPDGSLHASLPPDRAKEAIAAGWAVAHPWADRLPGGNGFVMLFTPRTVDEADTIFGLVVDGYNYVTGLDLRAKEIGVE